MYALVVTIQVQPERREEFIKATLDDAKGSIQNEPGCLRFDVLQDLEDPNRIHLYEVYREEADHLSHREQPHYIKWRDATQDWREESPYDAGATPSFPWTRTGRSSLRQPYAWAASSSSWMYSCSSARLEG